MTRFIDPLIYKVSFDNVYWLKHWVYQVLEEVLMIYVQEGFRILGILVVCIRITGGFIVLIGKPERIKDWGLCIKFVPEREFLIHHFVKSGVPSYVGKISN